MRHLAVFLFAVGCTGLTVGAEYLNRHDPKPPPTVAIFVFWYIVGLVMSYRADARRQAFLKRDKSDVRARRRRQKPQ